MTETVSKRRGALPQPPPQPDRASHAPRLRPPPEGPCGPVPRSPRARRQRGHVLESLGVTLGVAVVGLGWAAVESRLASLYPPGVSKPRPAVSSPDPAASPPAPEAGRSAPPAPAGEPADGANGEPERRPDGESGDGEAALAAAVAGLPEASVWLLDGYNVLHTAFFRDQERRAWWRGPHRRRLVECAARFSAPAGEIWVVFDGPHPPPDEPTDGRVRIHFAPSADEWIARSVRRAAEPERLAVVTSDRQVQGRAAHHGARVVSPAAFLAACAGEARSL